MILYYIIMISYYDIVVLFYYIMPLYYYIVFTTVCWVCFVLRYSLGWRVDTTGDNILLLYYYNTILFYYTAGCSKVPTLFCSNSQIVKSMLLCVQMVDYSPRWLFDNLSKQKMLKKFFLVVVVTHYGCWSSSSFYAIWSN